MAVSKKRNSTENTQLTRPPYPGRHVQQELLREHPGLGPALHELPQGGDGGAGVLHRSHSKGATFRGSFAMFRDG